MNRHRTSFIPAHTRISGFQSLALGPALCGVDEFIGCGFSSPTSQATLLGSPRHFLTPGFLWIHGPVNTWDEAKRRTTLAERGLDFAEAELVFAGRVMTLPDERRDYRERRFITAGWFAGSLRDRVLDAA